MGVGVIALGPEGEPGGDAGEDEHHQAADAERDHGEAALPGVAALEDELGALLGGDVLLGGSAPVAEHHGDGGRGAYPGHGEAGGQRPLDGVHRRPPSLEWLAAVVGPAGGTAACCRRRLMCAVSFVGWTAERAPRSLQV